MFYEGNVLEATFVHRDNRFIARCLLGGKEVLVHVPNTGRCQELLLKGERCYLLESQNPKRKTRYSLIAINKAGRLINLDSGAPNKLVKEAGLARKIPFMDPASLKSEVTFGHSRLDFADKASYFEVKGVTLERKNLAAFPDAVTERGARHIQELVRSMDMGKKAHLIFVIQMEGVDLFSPNQAMDPFFAQTLEEAMDKGLGVHAYDCKVSPGEIHLNRQVPIQLGVDFYA